MKILELSLHRSLTSYRSFVYPAYVINLKFKLFFLNFKFMTKHTDTAEKLFIFKDKTFMTKNNDICDKFFEISSEIEHIQFINSSYSSTDILYVLGDDVDIAKLKVML